MRDYDELYFFAELMVLRLSYSVKRIEGNSRESWEEKCRESEERFKQFELPKKKCLNCNSEFIIRWKTERKKTFCSDICKQRYKASKKTILKRCEKQQISDVDLSITLAKVFNRDKKCYICGCIPSFQLHYFDDQYPTIDHVKPLSKGGTHTWDNVKLSCRKCNVKKSTKY